MADLSDAISKNESFAEMVARKLYNIHAPFVQSIGRATFIPSITHN